ncbi:hypothetical protein, variant [Aphanomyces invadans]|uniref:TRAPPC10/Trs130 N-terminal domain-containing protein n=1 Tax=Aphanomyces invadans TaxID=157072 RepID=A0A024TNK1_9STRA|nr:hypothetical protein, variant [Aphanomyces invadans]ETV95584.1 hypothetical protein, variant [Aphanomyces invadans]|eukprot:XP_008875777.1 hypothetical protein, variant [Aphanomyces invadans]
MERRSDAGSSGASLYASIPLLPQLKDYGYVRSTTSGSENVSPSTAQVNGISVTYEDHGGVWQFLSPSLSQRLPLRGIVWKNHLQSNKTIDRLHVNFQQLEPSSPVGGTTSLVHLFVVKCEDMESYKAKIKPSLSSWVDRMALQGHEWLVLYVPLGTQAPTTLSSSSVARGLGLGALSQSFRDSSKVYRKIFERMKSDFADNRSDKSKLDRFCKIDVLDGSSGVPGQQQQHESQWSEVLIKLKACIMDAFDVRCAEYEDQLRVLDGKRALSGWDFCSFLQVKESLALLYIQATLYDDSLRHYDELDAIYAGLDNQQPNHVKVDLNDPIFTSTPFDLDMTMVRMNIAVNTASVVHVRLYLFCRQVTTLFLMESYVEVCRRGLLFIPQMVKLMKALLLPTVVASEWAVGAALALCVSCEPETSGSAATPASAMALGDLLYLARRYAKALDLSTTSPLSTTPWYPLKSRAGRDEITQLAAIQYARAGRVRLAAYLAAQQHPIAGTDDAAASPLLVQLHQYEKDQWWMLMHETLVRFMSAELSQRTRRVHNIVDMALHWLHLDAAATVDEGSKTVWGLCLQALARTATDTASSDVVHVVWTHVFEPSVVVVESSPFSVRLQVVVKNALCVDVSVQEIVVTCDREDMGDDCLTLDELPRPAPGQSYMRSSTSDMMDTIDNFTAFLDSGDSHTPSKASPSLERTDTQLDDHVVSLASTPAVLRARALTTLDVLETTLPHGRYKIRQLQCQLAHDVVVLLPLDEPVAFRVGPVYMSSMSVDILCPPILSPRSSTPLTVVVRPHQDIVRGGSLRLTVRGDHFHVSSSSPTPSHQASDATSSVIVVPLPISPPQQADMTFEFTLASTWDVCGMLDVSAVCHAMVTSSSSDQTQYNVTCHAEMQLAIMPLVHVTTAVRSCARDSLRCVQVEIVANDKVAVEIDPSRYEWRVDVSGDSASLAASARGANLLANQAHGCPGLSPTRMPNLRRWYFSRPECATRHSWST